MTLYGKGGQPLNRHFNAERITNRSIDELLGLCKSVIADGKVDQAEAEFLLNWFCRNDAATSVCPGNVIDSRIAHHPEDGFLDNKESEDLLPLIREITGEHYQALTPDNMSMGCFDHAQPTIVFPDKSFCFTGNLALAPRKACEQEVVDLGGVTTKNVVKSTDFLVIGSIGSADWIHTSYGRKIEKAKLMQADGVPIA